jgi:hypothetical protein
VDPVNVRLPLYELLADNARRIHLLLDVKDPTVLHWSPDREANSIAVLVWHVARVHDVFLTRNILAQPAEAEIWFRSGWMERADYDPRGLGTYGWGSLTGYTKQEVKQIPAMGSDLLLGYFDEVAAAVRGYLEVTPYEVLMEASAGFEGKQTNYFWIRHPLFDMTRHIGEMQAIRAMWDRRHGQS